MKHTMLLYLLILPAIFVQGQPVQFEKSIRASFEKAKLDNKPVFIEFYNSECIVCLTLEPVFSDAKMGEYYNAQFVNYKLDTKNMKTEDSLFMVKSGLVLTSVPYFLFFDKNEKFLHYSDTKPDVNFLIGTGIKALNPDERAAGLENKYKSGDRTIKTLFAYSLLVQLYNNDSLAAVLADDLFIAFPKKDLGNQKSYIITKNCVNSIENGFFKYWIQNMDRLAGLETEKHKGQEKQRLAEIVRKSIYSKASGNWDLDKIAAVKKYILLTGLSKDPEAFIWEKETTLLVQQKRYHEALSIGKKMLDEEKQGIKASLGVILHFFTILSTTNELNTVKNWLEKIASRKEDVNDEADIMYLNALYYTKTNQAEKAGKTIAAALTFYKKNKLDTKLLTDLMSPSKQ
jgi:thiol-disulfide isomerase/thioredoxin